MSAHPKLTALADFITEQQSYTISANRRKWIEAGKMLKSYMDELALKSEPIDKMIVVDSRGNEHGIYDQNSDGWHGGSHDLSARTPPAR